MHEATVKAVIGRLLQFARDAMLIVLHKGVDPA